MNGPVQIALAGLLAPTHEQARPLLAQAPAAVPCALAELWRLGCDLTALRARQKGAQA
jgi:hypothetical protein